MKNFNFIVILFSLFFMNSCDKVDTNEGSSNLKSFLQEKGLDKRTTLFNVAIENGVIKGDIESIELKNQLISTLEKTTGKTFIDSLQIPSNIQVAYIRNSVGNVRSQGKHSAELSTQYLMGQEVKILKKADSWYYIQGPDKYLGWIDGGGIVYGEAINDDWRSGTKKVIQVNETVGFNEQGAVTDLVFGNKVVQTPSGQYLLPDGREIELSENDFDENPEQNKIERMIDRAESLMGRPYLWGGTSAKGMDCSGFTRTSFMDADYLLGRDASLQALEGSEVDVNDLSKWERGDLFFFGNLREDGSQRITHVGINLGEGRMIHEAQRVQIESLNPNHEDYNDYRRKSLLRVKRIL